MRFKNQTNMWLVLCCLAVPGFSLAAGSAESLWAEGEFAAAWTEAPTSADGAGLLLAAQAAIDHAVYVLAPDGEKQVEVAEWLDHGAAAAESALALNLDPPQAAAAWMLLARARGEKARRSPVLKNLDVASELKRMFDEALILEPDNADALAGLGMWHLELTERKVGWLYGADRNEVEALLQRSISLAPEQINLRNEYATALQAFGQPNEAREQLEAALTFSAVNAVERFEQERARKLLAGL